MNKPNHKPLTLLVAVAILALVVALIPSSTAAYQDPTWYGEYFSNLWLGGSPAMTRQDADVNFDWGSGSPGGGIPTDNWSARWSRRLDFTTGTYRFTATTDDGVRLWVDGTVLIDEWHPQSATAHSADVDLTAGEHTVRMEYYEAGGVASAQLRWELLDGTGNWYGEYFNNTSLSGSPALTRYDAEINFDWGTGSPAGINSDNWSARWTRSAGFPTTGTYRFTATTDDGVRLWVDEVKVLDSWYDHAPLAVTGDIVLAAGDHDVRVEYYEHLGTAAARVSWDFQETGPAPVEVIVDDNSTGLVLCGPRSGWHTASTGYAGRMIWTQNTRLFEVNYGTWTPDLPHAQSYEVQVYIPYYYTTTGSARYRIVHNGQTDEVVVNQNLYNNQWVSLGTYYFAATGDEHVRLSDVTGEPDLSTIIGFDAVRWIGAGLSPPPPPPPPPSECSVIPRLGFGEVWNGHADVRSKLGCATELESYIYSGEQFFQRGYMLWISDTETIYALYDDGTWQSFADTWEEGQPETDPNIVAPAGYYQPKRGFGKVWREQPGVRDKLGWGINEEYPVTAAIEPFEHGTMTWTETAAIRVLYSDGHWQQF